MKLLIFDADGTIFDSNYAIYKVWQIIANEYNRDIFSDFNHFKKIFMKHHGKWESYAIHEFGFEETDFEKIIGIWLNVVDKIYEEYTKWLDGMIEVLPILEKRKYTIAIATNNDKEIFEGLFRKQNMSYEIHDQLSHKGKLKPSPDMIFDHMHKLGFSQENTVMIGDTITDLSAARNAGVVSIWAKYGSLQQPSQLEGYYDYVLESPYCLLEIFPWKTLMFFINKKKAIQLDCFFFFDIF